MLRSKTYRSILVLSPFALVAAAIACSNDAETPGGTGGGAGAGAAPSTGGSAGSGAGASGGNGTGGSGSGATSNTGGNAAGGNGTGGSSGGSSGGSGGSSGGGGGSGGGTGGGVVPGTSGYNCEPASGEVPELKATEVVGDGLSQPLYVAHEPNGAAGRLFVLERTGAIRIIENGTLVTTPFLDFSSKVGVGAAGGDERGALGMAFHPDYATNGLFYVHYSDKAATYGDSVFEEYKVSSDPNVADAASGRVVLKVTQPNNGNAAFKNHKGGAINFGSDGFLYIGLGDGGGSGDVHGSTSGNGQNLGVLLGKILRIDPEADGANAYSSPAGNLKDTMSSAAPEIWDYGMRNPFRFTFDGCTGDLYIGDVGQDRWEEVDVEKPGEGGKNYGWNITEGTHCYVAGSGTPNENCDKSGKVAPVLDYDRQAGQSITGGAVYRGSAIPALRGSYFYADYNANKVWMTVYDREAGTVSTPVSLSQELSNATKIVSITNGADGELYFTAIEQGAVYKLEAAQ